MDALPALVHLLFTIFSKLLVCISLSGMAWTLPRDITLFQLFPHFWCCETAPLGECSWPWLVWLSWLGIVLQTGRSSVWFLVLAHAWDSGSVPSQSGCMRRMRGQNFSHWCFSPCLFPPFSSLKLYTKIKFYFFKKRMCLKFSICSMALNDLVVHAYWNHFWYPSVVSVPTKLELLWSFQAFSLKGCSTDALSLWKCVQSP